MPKHTGIVMPNLQHNTVLDKQIPQARGPVVTMLHRTRSIQALPCANTVDHTDRNALPFDGIVTLGVCVPNIMQWKRNVQPLPQT